MLDLHQLKAEDLQRLDADTATKIAMLLLDRVGTIADQLGEHAKQLAERDQAIKFKDAKLQKVSFELARLKAWKFGAKTEAMAPEQRGLFEETVAEDEAALQAQLDALRGKATTAPSDTERRRPRRQPLPDNLRRVEHHHEPEDTHCPTPGCGRPMVRIGEDVSERLDIIPAEFFVHRHVRGKWACKCCQVLVQQPVEPQIIDQGIPAPGLVAHTLVSRFVDHIPYYRQEEIKRALGRAHTARDAGGLGRGCRCGPGAAVRGA